LTKEQQSAAFCLQASEQALTALSQIQRLIAAVGQQSNQVACAGEHHYQANQSLKTKLIAVKELADHTHQSMAELYQTANTQEQLAVQMLDHSRLFKV